jgi:F-type H+-transporting ATPase subunit gamma
MAKARAIVKRRKAVRNIRKITKTMQMIATAKFQKALKRAIGTKPFAKKVRELVADLAGSLDDVSHPLLRKPEENSRAKIAIVVITSNRGLAGAYNGSVLRMTGHFVRDKEREGKQIDLLVAGRKGYNYFKFQKRPVAERLDAIGDEPKFAAVEPVAQKLMDKFVAGEYDAVYVAYMNFVSAGQQKPDIAQLLPLAQPEAAKEKKTGGLNVKAVYDFVPDAESLLNELLPLTVKTQLFQCFLDGTTSEHVSRMIAMKSATDNAEQIVKDLTMQYNRARQSQITTELSEIMGGVEAMKN